jgi:hypothetical protein
LKTGYYVGSHFRQDFMLRAIQGGCWGWVKITFRSLLAQYQAVLDETTCVRKLSPSRSAWWGLLEEFAWCTLDARGNRFREKFAPCAGIFFARRNAQNLTDFCKTTCAGKPFSSCFRWWEVPKGFLAKECVLYIFKNFHPKVKKFS